MCEFTTFLQRIIESDSTLPHILPSSKVSNHLDSDSTGTESAMNNETKNKADGIVGSAMPSLSTKHTTRGGLIQRLN